MVVNSVVKFTATFDGEVTGVTAADFNVQSSVAGVTWTETLSTTDNKAWELILSVASGSANTNFDVSMADSSGTITNPNAAGTNNGFTIRCAYTSDALAVDACSGVSHACAVVTHHR